MATLEAIRSMRIEDNSSTSFTWTGLPTTYESWRLYMSHGSNRAPTNTQDTLQVRLGASSASSSGIYGLQDFRTIWNVSSGGTDYGQTSFRFPYAVSARYGYEGLTVAIMDIYGVNDSDTLASLNGYYCQFGLHSMKGGVNDNNDSSYITQSGLYNSNVALDTLSVSLQNGNLLAGSEYYLYGYNAS
jgi:hypothetical protein